MPADNRTNILDQAVRLFAYKGYDAVGVQEIVDAAGVTKPTLYHYFGSKQGVLEAALARDYAQLNTHVRGTLRSPDNLPLTLTEITRVTFRFAQEHHAFYRLALRLDLAPPDSVPYRVSAPYRERRLDVLEAMFRDALPHMAGRHRRYALTLVGMVNTYVLWSFQHPADLDGDLIYQAVHQFMHGIYS